MLYLNQIENFIRNYIKELYKSRKAGVLFWTVSVEMCCKKKNQAFYENNIVREITGSRVEQINLGLERLNTNIIKYSTDLVWLRA